MESAIQQQPDSPTNGSTAAANATKTSLFRMHYRDINFDTLRDRHDNFSFQKVIDMKNKLNDTMHFQGILQNPTTPKLILFQRQNGPLSMNRNRDNGINGLNGGMSTEGSYMPSGKTPNVTFIKEFSPTSARGKQFISSGDYKTQAAYFNSAGLGHTFGGGPNNTHDGGLVINSGTGEGRILETIHDRETESRMWREFNSHFNAKNRERG